MIDVDDSGRIIKMNEWQGIVKYSEKTYLNVTLNITDRHRTCSGLEHGPS
jgi:hypothetical protein